MNMMLYLPFAQLQVRWNASCRMFHHALLGDVRPHIYIARDAVGAWIHWQISGGPALYKGPSIHTGEAKMTICQGAQNF